MRIFSILAAALVVVGLYFLVLDRERLMQFAGVTAQPDAAPADAAADPAPDPAVVVNAPTVVVAGVEMKKKELPQTVTPTTKTVTP